MLMDFGLAGSMYMMVRSLLVSPPTAARARHVAVFVSKHSHMIATCIGSQDVVWQELEDAQCKVRDLWTGLLEQLLACQSLYIQLRTKS